MRPALSARAFVVLRDRDAVSALAPLLADTGVAAEVTSVIPGSLELIGELRAEYGRSLSLAAGTVVDADYARAAVRAGAQAIITPHVVPGLPGGVDAPVVMGALSPTEVAAAAAEGAAAVKVFPAAAVGGPAYVRALRGPFPQVPLVPSGGVRVADLDDYLAAGAVAVALGTGSLLADTGAAPDLRALLAHPIANRTSQERTPHGPR